MKQIFQAETAVQIASARALFREYEKWLGLDLCFQGFEDELENLPGKYAPPEGRLYLLNYNEHLSGCIALRKLKNDVCEMKRLYIRQNARGQGLGNTLIKKLIEEARQMGYTKMRLDTYPPKMAKAVKLYQSHDFREVPAYYANPHDGVLFMEMVL